MSRSLEHHYSRMFPLFSEAQRQTIRLWGHTKFVVGQRVRNVSPHIKRHGEECLIVGIIPYTISEPAYYVQYADDPQVIEMAESYLESVEIA